MESSYFPRPEDFRLAWPNALRNSLIQVGEMQLRADDQLKKSEEIALRLHEQAQLFRKDLHDTGTVVLQQLHQAGAASAAVIKAATDKLIVQTERLVIKEQHLQTEAGRMARQLDIDRRQFEDEKKWLFQQPVWRRLLYVCKNRE